MTTIVSRVGADVVDATPVVERKRWGTLAMKLLTTTDHKVIYRVEDGIPVMLPEEGIGTLQLTDFPAA